MLASPLTLFRRLPPAVRLLITGALVNRLGGFIVPYLAIVLRREFRLTASEVGLLLTCYGAGSLVSVLIGGVVADRLGRRLAMMASLFGGGGLACLMGLSPSIRVFIPLLVIFGFVADLYRPAASSVIGDLLPPAQRAVGFAALRPAQPFRSIQPGCPQAFDDTQVGRAHDDNIAAVQATDANEVAAIRVRYEFPKHEFRQLHWN